MGTLNQWNTSSVCAVCVCVGGSVGEGQEWAMRMKRNRENKSVNPSSRDQWWYQVMDKGGH